MIIDLFTVVAQIINFLILVFLLKKFLFSKITGIMDERESQINKRLSDAEQREKEAEQELEKQRKIREKLEQEWEDNLAKIKREVQAKREKMIEEARQSVNQLQQEWKRAISTQRQAFLQELRKLSGQQVCLISKKVLADLANSKLENQLIESFLNQLEELEEDKKKEFRWDESKALKEENKNKVEIHTAFPLDEESKALLTKKVKKLVHKDVQPVYHTSGDLICGIELRSEGKKIAWSVEHYLDMLEKVLKDIWEEDRLESELEEDRSEVSDKKKEE